MSEASETPITASDIRAKAAASKPRQRGVALIPEWGGSVYACTLSGDQRADFDRETLKRKKKTPDKIRVRERLTILTAEDTHGAKAFTPADEDMLAAMDVGPVDRFFKLSARLNGFLDDEDDGGPN